MNYNLQIPSISMIYLATFFAFPSIAGTDINSNPITLSTQKIIPSTSFPCNNPAEEINAVGWSPVKRKQTWCGQVRKELRSAVPTRGYITNNADWLKLWKTYRSDEKAPIINFDRELILVYVHIDNNDVNMSPMLSIKGDLSNNISFTERAGADSPCNYIFGSIDRRGIKTIAGKAILIK
jgi:hypothetical protein